METHHDKTREHKELRDCLQREKRQIIYKESIKKIEVRRHWYTIKITVEKNC